MVMILMMLETKVDPLPTSLYFSQPGSNKSIEMRMMLTCCTKNENEANYHHDKRDPLRGASVALPDQNKLLTQKWGKGVIFYVGRKNNPESTYRQLIGNNR